jgi:rhamnosyltransferase
MTGPRPDQTAAVIVTLDPDEGLPQRMAGLIKEVAAVIIVDNGSGSEAVGRLKEWAARTGIEILLNRENLGIAAALNRGIGRAEELGFGGVVLFDQDSEPEPGLLTSLTAIFEAFPGSERLALTGSNYFRLDPGHPEYRFPTAGHAPWIERRSVITSGTLIPLERYREIGPFREELFIDHVDDEYCFRARRLGFRVVMSRVPLMRHAIGDRGEHSWFGHTVETSNHSPARRYYMGRNAVLVARQYLFTEPGWAVMRLWKLLKTVLLIVLFERHKGAKVRHLLRGVRHGLLGRSG